MKKKVNYFEWLQEVEFDLEIDDVVWFSHAINSGNSNKWTNSIKDDLKSIEQNKIWDLFEILEDFKIFECKWIFKTRQDLNGNIERYKARLVTQSFTKKK
jgi:hypothetical protein